MNSTSSRCLSVQELVAHRNGDLTNDRKKHLSSCELCRASLDGLEMIDESTQQALIDGSFIMGFEDQTNRAPRVSKTRNISPSRWLVAASVLLALGWASWQYYPANESNSIFETAPLAYVEQPYRRQMRSAGITTDLYGDAAYAFSIDSFNTSITLYQAAIQKAPTDLLRTRGQYEIGIAYWKAGLFEMSIDNLTRARMGELDYYEDATWALAQLYRQTGYLDEALKLYEDLLLIEKSPYVPKAKQMIDLINGSE